MTSIFVEKYQPSTLPPTLGQYLKSTRIAKELTLQKASDLIGCSKSSLWDIERDNFDIRLSMLIKICDAYSIKIAKVLSTARHIQGAS